MDFKDDFDRRADGSIAMFNEAEAIAEINERQAIRAEAKLPLLSVTDVTCPVSSDHA